MDNILQDKIFRKNVIGTKDYTTIPDQYLKDLTDLLNKLENETGTLYSASIQEIGCHHPVTLNQFDKRSRYIISHMKSEYKELEGEYSSVIEIKKRISRLQYGNLLINDVEWKNINSVQNNGYVTGNWRCPECGNETNCVTNGACQSQKCRYSHQSIWRSVSISLTKQEIYSAAGGSLSICYPLGKITCFN